MADDVVYISPSYRRAGAVRVRKLLPETVLAVHEFEAEEYREREGGDLLVLPDDLRGNMARVRNAMLDYAFERADRVVCLDDDVFEFGRFHWNRDEGRWRHVWYEGEQIRSLVANGFIMADDLGVKLWGVNVTYDPRFYREYQPLTLLSPVLGPFSCIVNNPLRYDVRFTLNEDYDYFLQHIERYRSVLRLSSYFYKAEHLATPGGVASYRTLDREREEAEVMQRKWGRDVVSYRFDRSTNPIVRVPLAGM